MGFVETRINCSSFGGGSADFGFDFFVNFGKAASLLGRKRSKRLRQANPKSFGSGDRREAPAQERPEFAMNRDADFAVRAVAQMNLERVLLLIGKRSIEEEVHHAFHIVTEHHCFPSGVEVTAHSSGRFLRSLRNRRKHGSQLGCSFVNSVNSAPQRIPIAARFCNRAANTCKNGEGGLAAALAS
ncbi:MAG TPA: hypothetical protein VF846_05375 [Thermoanaerobaculia bacterium]